MIAPIGARGEHRFVGHQPELARPFLRLGKAPLHGLAFGDAGRAQPRGEHDMVERREHRDERCVGSEERPGGGQRPLREEERGVQTDQEAQRGQSGGQRKRQGITGGEQVDERIERARQTATELRDRQGADRGERTGFRRPPPR